MASSVSRLEPPSIVAAGLIARGLELSPVPAAHLARDRQGFCFLAVNSAYVAAGLGIEPSTSAMLSALSDRIDAFLQGGALKLAFDWNLGGIADYRYYRVTLARSASSIVDRCTVTLLDQTSQHLTERSLRREMTTDSLTGLLNREGFADLVETAHDKGVAHAVLVVDLDRFGRLNACLGSLAGDELLITVARRLRGSLRARDTLARIDGSEFAILMVIDDRPDEAEQLATRIHAALKPPFRLSSYELGVRCSIGIAFGSADGPDDGIDPVRHAKFAARRAKASGRTETYQNQALAAARDQFAMETALRRAIERGELRLVFQPIRRLATDELVGFEALARWTDGEGRHHSPNAFIPVAEESGLIVPLGRWAVDEAAATLARWDAAAGGHCGVAMGVNISSIQLQRDDIPAVVARALATTGLAGERLTLELTESAIVTDPERIAATMRALKALGPTLALDDFGTGYSNLGYLQQLPIDVLKIDRSFVTDMTTDRDKMAIVRAILSLAQALGMRTTAEGIETLEVGRTLAAMGCTNGQGYAYARPLEAEDAFAVLTASGS